MPSLPKPTTALLAVFLLVLATQFALNSTDDGGGLQFSITDAVDWSGGMSSAYDGLKLALAEEEDFEDGDVEGERRSLFWRAARYYISYGALSANRVPCPPRSGRSYYTHNCYRARGPIRPYVRGCSAISRCRR
ncbi:unnamed protein product [Rhodiola kirilowii]